MPDPTLHRKTLFFAISIGIVILTLFALPLAEAQINAYLLARIGLIITPEGKVIGVDGSTPSQMVATSSELIVTIFSIIKILLWMILVVTVVRFGNYLIFSKALRTAGQAEVSALLRPVLSIVVYIVAFFIIFQSQYPNVDLTAIFTGSTIIGIVVGLALQDTLGNLFAGIALQADQPFQVGDIVSIPGSGVGIVETVSWRGVKIRTFQNKLLVISNSVLGKETIEVAPRDNLNARIVKFNTLYTNSPSKTIQVVREAVRQVENVSPKHRPIVRIRDLGESGIDWEIKYWCEDYKRFNETDALIRQRVWYVFNREKIDFAYPTRTIHVEPKPAEVTEEEFIGTISEYLERVPIFAPLSDEEIDQIAHSSTQRVFAPGEEIVHEGDPGHSMFVITRGAVAIQVLEQGKKRTVNRLRTNDFFGEMSLLTGEPRTATVIAEEETEILRIDKSAMEPIFMDNPTLMKLVSEIVEERRESLAADSDEESPKEAPSQKRVFDALRKFFGLK
jgi:small-conductance mechanosensitive channel